MDKKYIIGRTEKNDKLRNIIVKEKKYDFSNGYDICAVFFNNNNNNHIVFA